MDIKTYALYELNAYLRRVLALNLPDALWIRAEIWQANQSRGHRYFELVEKAADTDELAAQAQAVLWETAYRRLRRQHGPALDGLLREGLEVRLKVRVDFHERYGLKLVIDDIDPAYTLGQLELRRRQTLESLAAEGLLDRNRALTLPLAPQRLAVISSPTAAGYQDFCTHLLHNPYGYKFGLTLFPAAVQGVAALTEAPKQLRAVARLAHRYDAVVFIRGGGSRTDLAVFDEPELCRAAAALPLPLLTGIGHDTDESVLDRVAHTALKTPTAVADFLLERALRLDHTLGELGLQLQRRAQQQLHRAGLHLLQTQQRLQAHNRAELRRQHEKLQYLAAELPRWSQRRLRLAQHDLRHWQQLSQLLGLDHARRRGFSLVLQQGRIIYRPEDIAPEAPLHIYLPTGELHLDPPGPTKED